jgi:hypothetical protein
MKEHKINKSNLFIKGYYVDDEVCDKVIKYFNNHPDWHTPGETDTKENLGKKSTDAPAHCEHIEIIPYSLQLKECVNLYKKIFPVLDNDVAEWGMVENMNIQKYKPNEGYLKWHTESSNLISCHRHLVFMTYLTDVRKGGETEWFHQKIKIKPEKGLTVLWPADWTHLHRGCPATKEEKLIITGWYSYIR